MRAVNLLPRETKQRTVKKESVPVLVGACAGVLVFALLGAMFLMLSAKSPISPSTGESSSSSTAPSQFTISGRTYSHDAVARLLSRLQVVPDLTNVQLLSSSRSEVAGQEVVDFSIAADIKVLGGPSS